MKNDVHDLPIPFISSTLCKERLLAKIMNVKVNNCLFMLVSWYVTSCGFGTNVSKEPPASISMAEFAVLLELETVQFGSWIPNFSAELAATIFGVNNLRQRWGGGQQAGTYLPSYTTSRLIKL
jgi:hypothetical protein